MPYISPALSPTKAFAASMSYPSPPNSTPSTPGSSVPNSPSSFSLASQSGVQFSASYANGFPGRPANHRHHSRAHSSDVLMSVADARHSNAKATPDFIFVHPASPADERSSPSSYFRSSSTNSLLHSRNQYRSTLRSVESSRTNHSSSPICPPGAGDHRDVAPPRTNRRKKFQIGGSADSSPSSSHLSLENGQAFAHPLPDLETMSPPSLVNRSSSSPALLSLAEESRRQSGEAFPINEDRQPSDSIEGTNVYLYDSALATSSSSGSASSSDTETTKLSLRLDRRNKASWGDSPTPTMGGSTAFSFGSSGNTKVEADSVKTPTNSSSSGTESASDCLPTPYGPFAPAAHRIFQRPAHSRAFSDRVSSPFRLELESTNRARQQEYAEPGNGHLRGHSYGHSHSAYGYGQGRRHPLPTPMLRKKSGELVKSSMKHDSRAKSAPATPNGPKAVHFDEQLERVKHFLAQQRPTAVSRDGSPIETETEDDSEAAFPFPPMTTSIPAQISLVLPDFPNNTLPDLGSRDVCLETLEIAADSKSLKGTALLRNIAFEKRLSIRFTLDEWQTVSEVTGEWSCTLVGGTLDRWSFSIKLQDMLARIEDRKMYIALRYSVNGQDIWDNNYHQNYRAEFRKQAARSQAVVGGARAARHEWAVTNPGQASERMADLRRELDRLVADQDDFGTSDDILLSNRNFRYSPKYLGAEDVPLAHVPPSSGFSARYDFGTSLKNEKAARNSPQTAHAILDNPYFAAPGATEAMISSWRNAASAVSPPNPTTASVQSSPPKTQYQNLYDDGSHLTTAVIGGMPATIFADPSSATPPASFSGLSYYPQTEVNGVMSTDFGLSNYMTALAAMASPVSPMSEDFTHKPSSASVFPTGDTYPDTAEQQAPSAEMVGSAPLARQTGVQSYYAARNQSKGHFPRPSSQESLLEPSLDDQDPLDRSIYSPAISPLARSPARRASPPPRPASPEDLLSPSPSSASTDTSTSTPQSPHASPPLKSLRPYVAVGEHRPDMDSDTYFNFVHRCKSVMRRGTALQC